MLHLKNPARLAVSAGLCTSLILGGAPALAAAVEVADSQPRETMSVIDSQGGPSAPAPAAEGLIEFNGETYSTLTDAFVAAKAGGTITLNGDISIEAQSAGDARGLTGEVILDLNGHTVYGQNKNIAIRAIDDDGGSLTIMNGAIDAQLGTYCTVGASNASLTLKDVRLSNCTSFGLSIKAFEGGVITAKNCTSTSEQGGAVAAAGGTVNLYECNFSQSGYFDWNSCLISASNGTGVVNVYSGTYTGENYGAYIFSSGGSINFFGGTMKVTGDKPAFKADLDLGSYPDAKGQIKIIDGVFEGGYELAKEIDVSISGGSFTVAPDDGYIAPGFKFDPETGSVVESAVATVTLDGKVVGAYEQLDEALKNAPAGSTVTLKQDVSGNGFLVESGTDFTLDLNGCTISGAADSTEAVLTVEGSLALVDSASTKGGIIATEESKSNSYVLMVKSGGSLNTDSVVLDGGEKATALYNKGAIATINGGNFSGKNGIINDNGGDIDLIEGLSIVAGQTGIKNNRGASLDTLKDCVVSAGQNALNHMSETPIQSIEGGNYTAKNGYAIGLSFDKSINSIDATVKSEGGNAIRVNNGSHVAIVGGSYTSAAGKPVFEDNTGGTAKVEISGGTFSAMPSEEYLVPGFGVNANPDGSFGIHQHLGTKVEGAAPACTEPGVVEHWRCKTCDGVFADADMTHPLEATEIPATGHDAEGAIHHEGKDAAVDAEGVIEHWECPACHALFLDAALTKDVTAKDVVLPKLDPEVKPGEDQKPGSKPELKPGEGDKVGTLPSTGDNSMLPIVATGVAGAAAVAAGVAVKRRKQQ